MAVYYYAEYQVFETKEDAFNAMMHMPGARVWAHDFEGSFQDFEAEFERDGTEALYSGRLVSR